MCYLVGDAENLLYEGLVILLRSCSEPIAKFLAIRQES